jgi:CBS domain-containing protein
MATETTLAQPIATCMTDWFVTLPHRESLALAARAMRDRGIGLLLVTDGDELVGVLSERDVVAAVADGDDLTEVQLADRARGEIHTIGATATLQAGVDLMVAAGTRHLVVVDGGGDPVGVLSARDVLSELSDLG